MFSGAMEIQYIFMSGSSEHNMNDNDDSPTPDIVPTCMMYDELVNLYVRAAQF